VNIAIAITGALIVIVVLWEAFETIILPRQVTRRWRVTRLFYRWTWKAYAHCFTSLPKKSRERMLSFYGPLSLVLLLSLWAMGMVLGFGMLHYIDGSITGYGNPWERFGMAIYFSGSTQFTLGLGDVAPHTPLSRFVTVAQSFVGLGFLAIVVGYFPVLYQAFSRREAQITLLDARAGSPPSATELLRRQAGVHGYDEIYQLLRDWERWSAELMESHLSYPSLCYFRSQHDNESWLSALATVLDASALVLVGIDEACEHQAQLTFAIARHAIVDISQVLNQAPVPAKTERLNREDLSRLRQVLSEAGMQLRSGEVADQRLADLISMYEPYLVALSRFLLMPLPQWIRDGRPDNWQTSAWGRITDTGAPKTTQVEHHL
jgi:hypothetical protein